MKNLLANAVFITACLSFYVYPVSAQYREQSQSLREVVEVSQKKHIRAEHVKGLDTYDRPIDYHVKEQFIIRFKDKNGHFVVPKRVYDQARVGDKFVTENNSLYYCRRSDGCYD